MSVGQQFGTLLSKIFGTKQDRDVNRLQPVVDIINGMESAQAALSDEELRLTTTRLRGRYNDGTPLEELLPEAFAAAREASRRTLGLRPFDVQLMGGIVLHEGRIAEMKTGEGKTLSATLPLYLNALTGNGAHLVTVNDYLARRDAEWMSPIFEALGITVGFIQSNMEPLERQKAYERDITYGTNNEFGFDYLRDNMVGDLGQKVQRAHNFAIVDEVDSILIDEARTPLIISGAAEQSTHLYREMDKLSSRLRAEEDYEIDEKDRAVTLTESGVHRIESMLDVGNLYEPENMHLVHHVVQAVRARELFKNDVDYVVKDGEVVIVDEFTGRLSTGRRWSDGLHQAIEAKERLPIKRENQTLATITYQNYFKLYEKLAGMTGTADTEAAEFSKIYNLDVVVLPTHKPMIRDDDADVVFKTEKEKFDACIDEIFECHERGQPVLVGTISIEKSEVLSDMLRRRSVAHHVLNAKHNEKEAEIVAQAGRLKAVTIATNMAGRGTDIMLGGNPKFLARLRAAGNDHELYEKELVRAKEECQAEHDEVIALGGLHILGTERHESRRIDNQLRGRSGRQGDPGTSRFYISLQDDLMRIFGGERVSKMMDVMKWDEGEPIIHPWVTKAIARAQERVELQNFEVRKRLLDYDNVMNQQREVIYELRDMALEEDADIDDYFLNTAEELLDAVLENDAPEKRPPSEWDTAHLSDYLKRQFDSPLTEDIFSGEGMTRENLREMLLSEIKGRYEAKKQEFGAENFKRLCRQIIMMQVDTKWRDHLYAMDALRQGIGWRGMGGSDPLVEYKHEGYAMFAGLVQALREDVITWVYHVKTESPERRERVPARRTEFSGEPTAQNRKSGDRKGGKGAAAVLTRKIGRNDPCSCGSGKKYKKCCGA